MYNDGIRRYQETTIQTIGPERMIVMLYEGIVSRLNAAREAVVTGDIPSRCTNLKKATDIITELDLSLDHAVGGEIAANLAGVYNYMKHELLDAHIKGDVQPIDNALSVIAPLLEAWRSIQPGTAERAKAIVRSGGVEDGPENAGHVPQEDSPTEDICVAV